MNLNRLDLYLGNNLSNFKTYEFGSFDIRDTGITYAGEWAYVHLPIRKFTTTGSYDCQTVDTIAIGHRAQAATQDTIFLGGLARAPKRDPVSVVLFHEDDNWLSFWQNGFPTMQALGLKVNMFVNGGRAGQTNFMTADQIQSACGTGLVRLSNHLYMHDSITDLSADSARNSIRRNAAFIKTFGPSCDESDIFAYPFGRHSRAIDSSQRDWKEVSYARTTKGNSFGEAQSFNSPYAMRIGVSLGFAVDTTTVKAIIDTAVAHRSVITILMHEICSACTPADANTWRQDWLTSVLNYAQTKISAGTMRNMSTGEYLERYGGGSGPLRRTGIGSN